MLSVADDNDDAVSGDGGEFGGVCGCVRGLGGDGGPAAPPQSTFFEAELEAFRLVLARGLPRGFATQVAGDPRQIVAAFLWGGKALAGGGITSSSSSAILASASVNARDDAVVVGSVEAAGTGRVLVRRFVIDRRWSVERLHQEFVQQAAAAAAAADDGHAGWDGRRRFRFFVGHGGPYLDCLLYTSPSPRDRG